MRTVARLPKTWLITALAIFVSASVGFTQQTTLLTESFESGNGVIPPAGWAIQQVTGSSPGVSFAASSIHPAIAVAFDGNKFVSYNSNVITTGSTRLKYTNALSTVNHTFVMVDFAWYEDPGFPSNADKVDVQWSTDSVTWTTAGTYNRYNPAAGWKIKHVLLPAGAENKPALYVAFLFTSAGGNNCSLDLVHVTEGPAAPGAYATIGNGVVSSNYPYLTYWMGGRTQMLFTAAELAAAGAFAGNFLSVGFNVISNSTQLMNGFNVKLGATTLTTLAAGYVNGLTAYYTTPYSVPGTGWQNVTLTTPFAWNGTSNVIVEICFANTNYTNYSTVNSTTVTGMTAGHYADTQTECTVATNNAPTNRPNIRFGIPLVTTPGALMGYARDLTTGLPVPGAIVHAGGRIDTTRSDGYYIIYNLSPGSAIVSYTANGYAPGSNTTSIVSGSVVQRDLNLIPGPKAGGLVKNGSTGAPLSGAVVTVGSVSATTGADGTYLTPAMSDTGTLAIHAAMTGFVPFTGSVHLVANTTTIFNIDLLPVVVAPGPVTAVLNNPANPVAVNLSWSPPFDAPSNLLYSNGPMITSFGTGFGGADESMLQSPVSSYGSVFNHAAFFRIADDFTIPSVAWNVSSIDFFGYQTGSTTTSTITAAYCRILSGIPGQPGTTVVWGDTITNRLSGSVFSNIYRVTVSGNNQRPIMKIEMNTPGLILPPGTYWVEFAALGTLPSGPWCPYVTINNTPVTGNGLQFQGTATGYVPIDPYGQGVPFNINGSPAGTLNVDYQVWRLQQGQESDSTLWNTVWTGNTTYTTDNSWPALASGPYRWAVKSIYSPPGQRFSAATFSNVIGKNWVAPVSVCVELSCPAFGHDGTFVQLVNTDYPDTNYSKITDAAGCVHFTNVWKGNYLLTIHRAMFQAYTQPVTVTGPQNFQVTLLQELDPVTNLTVNDSTLFATWEPPKVVYKQLDERFTSGSFTTNQWTVSGGTNWQISTTIGNPAPSAIFTWTPVATSYDQYLTSKSLAGIAAARMILLYDIFLDNIGTTSVNSMAVELWNGTAWSVLRAYNNQYGSFPWTTEAVDITSVSSSPDFRIRFHASGANSNDINNWNIDNIEVQSSDASGLNPCITGYDFYLNNNLIATIQDTSYTIPPQYAVYQQNYNACVEVVYNTGTSPLACYSFISHFLYPPRNLVVVPIENTACLTWAVPIAGTGLSGYNVYRDGKKMNLAPVASVFFNDAGVPNGPHTYIVRAAYGVYESLPAGPVTVTIIGQPSAPVTTAGQVVAPDNSYVSVPVNVENFTGITAFSLDLEYDPAVLTYIEFSNVAAQLAGLSISDHTLSPALHKLSFFWSGTSPQTIPTGSKMVDLYFNFHSGSTALAWNNTSNDGTDCEFAGSSGIAMLDIPTGNYYNNGLVQGIPAQVNLNTTTISNGQSFCFNATQTIIVAGNGNNFVIEAGGFATMIAGLNIQYLPGTAVRAGGYLLGYIAPAGPYCISPTLPAAVMSDTGNPNISGSSGVRICPNPTTGKFLLELPSEIPADKTMVDIYGIRGEKVFSSVLKGERKHEFSLSGHPVGVYFVRVMTETRVETIRVIRY